MSQFQLVGVAVFQAAKERPCCDLCKRRIKNQFILVGNGQLSIDGEEKKMVYGGTVRVGSECAKKITMNPKFEVEMQSMENFVNKLRIISAIPGTMFQLEGTPRNMKIAVKIKKDALQLQLTLEPLVLYVRERIKERFVRTPNPITEDQLTYLETLLGVKIVPFKTYFLNQIFT